MIDAGNWDLRRPIGATSMSNCTCGSTLALTTDDMVIDWRQKVLKWIHEEIERSGAEPSDILDTLRAEIRGRALAERDA